MFRILDASPFSYVSYPGTLLAGQYPWGSPVHQIAYAKNGRCFPGGISESGFFTGFGRQSKIINTAPSVYPD